MHHFKLLSRAAVLSCSTGSAAVVERTNGGALLSFVVVVLFYFQTFSCFPTERGKVALHVPVERK